jgi:hypothetical protein|tara:strand:+ start:1013 stop:1513 length:501 start_codon:yes stop_codon:yes gene_type:complete
MEETKNILKSNIFPKEFVEGAIAECIAQIKHSLDALNGDPIKGLKRIDNVKGTFLVAINEAASVLKMLEHYTDAALTPKHRLARYVLKSFVDKLHAIEGFMEVKRMHNKRVIDFAHTVTAFLVTIHTVMHADTKMKKRQMYTADFCGDDVFLDGYGAKLGKVITIH